MPDALALEPREAAPLWRVSAVLVSRLLAEKTEWSARHVERQRHRWVIVVEIGKRMLEVLLANVAVRSLRTSDKIGFDAEGVRPRHRPGHAIGEEVVHRAHRKGAPGHAEQA